LVGEIRTGVVTENSFPVNFDCVRFWNIASLIDVYRVESSRKPSFVTPPSPEGTLPLPILAAETEDFRATAEPSAAASQRDAEELLARLRSRDREALDALFGRYWQLVLGIALRILRDYGEAQDTVQETFFYLYRRSKLFDPAKGSAKAWIVQAALHRALDRKLYLKRRGFYAGTEIDSVHDAFAGATDLDHQIGTTLNRTKLQRALDELPEDQRRTLEMFYFEGLELREIAEELNDALGNIRHHYYRGLGRLRKSELVRALR
jgi:RNA polymerase sigma-70 factor, ECF subfamily